MALVPEHLTQQARRSRKRGYMRHWRVLVLALGYSITPAPSSAAVYVADPAATGGPNYYLTLLARLGPGDTLELPAGTYRERLNLTGIQGTAAEWITITGPSTGAAAVVTTDSDCCNNVQLGNTAYVAIKNLTIDSNSTTVNVSVDAINAKDGITHDILIENCVIVGAALDQPTVGIATRSTAWNWTIRRNRILEAGTGFYLGNSDGSAPFVAGVIENNLFADTIGYNIEIKYQNPYVAPAGMPAGARRTIIRDNVFLKRRPQSSWPQQKVVGSRPNLLVGGFPDTGPGAGDLYEIYGNLFYQNADGESLIQASGRVTIHDNVFVGALGTAIYLIDHDRALKYADVYHNTIYGGTQGVRFGNSAREQSRVTGNLVFAGTPISGTIGTQQNNITASVGQAEQFVASPSTQLGTMNFYPLPGAAQGSPVDLSPFASQTDFDRDFNRNAKGDGRYRGAYAGEGTNAGWQLDAGIKTTGVSPAPPANLHAQ